MDDDHPVEGGGPAPTWTPPPMPATPPVVASAGVGAPAPAPTPGSTGFDGLDADAMAFTAAATSASRSMRWPISLLSLGLLLFLLAIAGWWTQDAVGTVVNVGEADIGETITFTSDGGSYRLLSSGPLRPLAESTWCDLTYADESTRREVGGQGLQVSRLGVDRLLTFDPPAGTTTVHCTNRGSDTVGNGRFQVLDADGPMHVVLIGVIVAALACLALGIGGLLRAFRRSTAMGTDVRAMFDPGGFADEPLVDEGPDPD